MHEKKSETRTPLIQSKKGNTSIGHINEKTQSRTSQMHIRPSINRLTGKEHRQFFINYLQIDIHLAQPQNKHFAALRHHTSDLQHD